MSDEFPVEMPPELEEKLAEQAILQQALEDSKKKSAEYYDQLLRLKAEFDNYRKRVEKEKSDARRWGKQDVLVPLLSLVDIFEQAMTQAPNAKEVSQIVQGLQFLFKNFESFLKTEGLEPLDVLGKPFDPHTSEAMEQVEVEPDQVGKVVGVIQKGYALQGRVLRVSRVRVGISRPEDIQSESDQETTEETENQPTDESGEETDLSSLEG